MGARAEFALHPLRLQELVRGWLLEDTSSFDFAGVVLEDETAEFKIFVKSPGILAGTPFADAVFKELDLTATWFEGDGCSVTPVQEVARVKGSARHLLLAERVVMNVLSRASGVATLSARMLSALRNVNWKGILAGSRKTTPGFRMVEKYALLIGGVDCHRYDLSDMIMIKDNHVSLAGSITFAIVGTRRYSGFTHKIEVECRSLSEALEAADAGADIVMLDNFKIEELHAAAKEVKRQFPNILVEASGGVTEDNITSYASSYIDIISSSALVQGYKTVDMSMKVV